METSDFGDLDHGTQFRRLNRSRLRRVLTQGQMRARLLIVLEIGPQSPSQKSLIEDHDVVQALPPDGAN